MTVVSNSQTEHLVTPAISTEYPIIQEDSHRRLNQEEQRALDLASEEERETARNMVARLHVERGHYDPRGMIDSVRRKHAHRLIIATAKKFSCSAFEESHGGFIQLLLEFYMNRAVVFKLISSSRRTCTCWNNHGGCSKSCRLRDNSKGH